MVEKLNARLESRQKSSQSGDIDTIDASQIPRGATEISDSQMFHDMGVNWIREEPDGD